MTLENRIGNMLITAPDRDFVLIPGNGVVEATMYFSTPGRRNLSKYTLRYKAEVPSFKEFYSLINVATEYPSEEWFSIYQQVTNQKQKLPDLDIKLPDFKVDELREAIKVAQKEQSFKFPKRYPGFQISPSMFLRPSYLPNVEKPDLFVGARRLGDILNEHIVNDIRKLQPSEVVYKKVHIRVLNALDWKAQGTSDMKYVAQMGPVGEPTIQNFNVNKEYNFVSNSLTTGKVTSTSHATPLTLAYSIYPTREINEKIINKPSRLLLNGSVYENSKLARLDPLTTTIEQKLHTPYKIQLDGKMGLEIAFIPVYYIQGAMRTGEIVRLDGVTRRAGSYLRRDVIVNEKQDLVDNI